ncbi:MAG: IS66 family transposase [Firmicutes bacterium]|nr:IS66 family transposase [Bacillota bacterium]
MAHQPAPWSRDELFGLCASDPERVVDLVFDLWDRVNSLTQQVDTLTQKVADLERQVHQNSRNSHKPPSSDGYQKPAPKSLRKKSGKPSGGQIGHPGTRLEMRDHPDQIVTHRPVACRHCGEPLEANPSSAYDRRQVFDLVARIEVTEHRAFTAICSACHHETAAEFPTEVAHPVQYGPGVKAFLSYGSTYQLLPMERLCDFLEDLTGHRVSEGTVYNVQSALSDRLATYDQRMHARLAQEPVLHFDETGIRVAGRLHWLHSASTPALTYYHVNRHRGTLAMAAMNLLPIFQGVAVHDGLAAYWTFAQCLHGLCNAHHERELNAVLENDHQAWASDLIAHLHRIQAAVAEAVAAGRDGLDTVQQATFIQEYRTILERGLAENPLRTAPDGVKRRGRVKQTKTRNLLDRLDQHQDAVLRFMTDFRVPYTNNQAEQDVRMMKVHQKISGTFRSMTGAKVFARIRGYISTLKKQGLPVMEYLQQAIQGAPYLPPTPP